MSSGSNMSGLHLSPLEVASTGRSGSTALNEYFCHQMGQLCMSEELSDVCFIVEGIRLPAHRMILGSRNAYFKALLYGGLSESRQSEITLSVPLKPFKIFLRYLYSGSIELSTMTESITLETLSIANLYGCEELEQAVCYHLRDNLTVENVCAIFMVGRLYNLKKLTKNCLDFIDNHAEAVLQEDTFTGLTKDSLEEVISRDSFCAPEVKIFLAIERWGEEHSDFSVATHIRLSLMSAKELLNVVRPSNIFNAEELLEAMAATSSQKSIRHRGVLRPEQNIAADECMSHTIYGKYCYERGNIRHWISDGHGIIIELGTIFIINHMKFLLYDSSRIYSYYVEVATNQRHWERVIDYTQYDCSSSQFLYFPARAVRYIKFVDTNKNVKVKIIHILNLEVMYTANIPNIINGIVVPLVNIATVKMGATVIYGISEKRNSLINGDYKNYNNDAGYTCHQLGSGSILIKLAQPYIIDTIRLLLLDCDCQGYKYVIQTSIDRKNWKIVVNKQNTEAKSWQNLTFPSHTVVYIQIIGTATTSNTNYFHCVHFECPSQVKQE